MLVQLVLDASGMEPPLPFEKATDMAANLRRGEYLRMLHRRIPYPLFDFVNGISLGYSLKNGKDSPYEIIVFFPDDMDQLVKEGIVSPESIGGTIA